MKLPEPPPEWRKTFSLQPDKLLSSLTSNDVREVVQKANMEYLPWEKAKYLPIPPDLKPEEMWAIIKISRMQNIKQIILSDTKGERFGYWLPDIAHRELHFIDQKAGGSLIMDSQDLPKEARDRYLISSLMEEAIASSQIEGAVTTRKAAKEMLREGRAPKNYAEQMIINNYFTIKKIKEYSGKPLTLDVLHSLHRSMTKGTLPDPSASGRYRSESDDIVVSDALDGVVVHVPPPASDLTARMEKFFAFANESGDAEFIHPVIKAALLHFWLAYEHPYVDGNGRTARAVFYWYMLSNDYWLFEYISISRIILKSIRQYAKAYLHAEQDDGDLTYFIVYHLKAIHLAIEELHRYLYRKQRQMQEATKLLRNVPHLNYRQLALLQHAIKHPDSIYTIESHQNSHNVSYNTSRSDLFDLVDKGYLKTSKRGRTFYFQVVENKLNEVAASNIE